MDRAAWQATARGITNSRTQTRAKAHTDARMSAQLSKHTEYNTKSGLNCQTVSL